VIRLVWFEVFLHFMYITYRCLLTDIFYTCVFMCDGNIIAF